MSKMGDLLIEIEELQASGMDAIAISNITGMPLEWIIDVLKKMEEPEWDEPNLC